MLFSELQVMVDLKLNNGVFCVGPALNLKVHLEWLPRDYHQLNYNNIDESYTQYLTDIDVTEPITELHVW